MFYNSIFFADTRSVSDVSDFLIRYTNCDFLISPLHEDPNKKPHYHILINIPCNDPILRYSIIYVLGIQSLFRVFNISYYLNYFLKDHTLNKNDIYLHGFLAFKVYKEVFQEVPEDDQIL